MNSWGDQWGETGVAEIQGLAAWPDCRDRCQRHGQCDHWTWAPPNEVGGTWAAICYLKTGQPFTVGRSEGVVSGFKNSACDV